MIDVLNMLLGEEVFIAASDESKHEAALDRIFKVFDTLPELMEGLKNIDAEFEDIRVVHGVITPAEALPSDIEDISAFVVVANPLDDQDGFLIDAGDTTDHIEYAVTDVIDNGIAYTHDIDIDYIFVLYGYELSLVFTVDEDEVDDETIDSCKKVAEKAKKIFKESTETAQ
jgi:hypothetical protein